jgi:hypothetical protein
MPGNSLRELRTWCVQNRNRCYVPEWLTEERGIDVDPGFSGVALQSATGITVLWQDPLCTGNSFPVIEAAGQSSALLTLAAPFLLQLTLPKGAA